MITKNEILKIIKPETPLERRICEDPDFIDGVKYGKERKGHPEGQIIYHIGEVLQNIQKYHKDHKLREKLRLITLIHDSFKHQVDPKFPRLGDNHHSRIAYQFAKKYITDQDMLLVIKYHDDAYNIWKKGSKTNDWEKSYHLIHRLLTKINVDLYFMFYRCDNETGDKTQKDLIWFEEIITEKSKLNFDGDVI